MGRLCAGKVEKTHAGSCGRETPDGFLDHVVSQGIDVCRCLPRCTIQQTGAAMGDNRAWLAGSLRGKPPAKRKMVGFRGTSMGQQAATWVHGEHASSIIRILERRSRARARPGFFIPTPPGGVSCAVGSHGRHTHLQQGGGVGFGPRCLPNQALENSNFQAPGAFGAGGGVGYGTTHSRTRPPKGESEIPCPPVVWLWLALTFFLAHSLLCGEWHSTTQSTPPQGDELL